MAIDWDGLANKTLNTAIDVIARKVEGVKPVGVTIGSQGVSFYASSVVLPLLIMAGFVVMLVLLIRKF